MRSLTILCDSPRVRTSVVVMRVSVLFYQTPQVTVVIKAVSIVMSVLDGCHLFSTHSPALTHQCSCNLVVFNT